MHFLRIFIISVLTLLLSACAENTPVKKDSPSGFDTTQLNGQWWLVSNLSNNDQEWSKQKPTALRRFYSRMSFQLPNKFGTTVLHPTDRHYSVVGTYGVQGNIVSTEHRLSSDSTESANRRNKLVKGRFVVIKINDNDMVIRQVPVTAEVTENAIDKSRLVGSWRAGERTIRGSAGYYLLTPCTQKSSTNPCHLVLQASGQATIRVNESRTLTVVPDTSPLKFTMQAATWTLSSGNQLVVKANQKPQRQVVLELSDKGQAFDGRINYSTVYWK